MGSSEVIAGMIKASEVVLEMVTAQYERAKLEADVARVSPVRWAHVNIRKANCTTDFAIAKRV